MTVLAISNIVNVNVRATPSLLGEVNVNNALLLTNETPSNSDEYRTYFTARAVGLDYGTNSDAFKMATALFSQDTNILTGNGKLVVAPLLSSVSATRGKFTTASLTANLTALRAVANGDIRVVLNGDNVDVTDLDFRACITLADIATVMQRKLPDVTISVETSAIVFTSKTVGADSTVDVVQLTGGSGTDLSVSGLLNVAAGAGVDGDNSSGETIFEAITRLTDKVAFTPVLSNILVEDTVAIATATAVEGTKKIWFYCWSAISALSGVIDTIKAANNRTAALLHTDVSQALLFLAAKLTSFSVDFGGSNTFKNANDELRSLTGVNVDNGITQAVYDLCQAKGVSSYDNFGVSGITNARYGDTGLFIDQVYGRTALEFSLQVAGFNALRSGAVTQTPDGLDVFLDAMNATFARFVRCGYIGVGLVWNSPVTFGNATDFRNAITAVGYYIYGNPLSLQLQSEREARQAPLTQAAYKEAGFVYRANVDVLVEA